jgi:hypothetical protein
MSVDIVSLVYKADATQLTSAEKAFDSLTAAVGRSEAADRRRATSTAAARQGYTTIADATRQAAVGTVQLTTAQGTAERSTRAMTAASKALRDQRMLEAAAMRELVTATKAYERDVAAAAKSALAAQVAADRESERSAQQAFTFRVRMAKQRAAEESAAAKVAIAAQNAADREVERSAQQLLQFRVRMANQRSAEEAAATKIAAVAQAAADRDAERSGQQLLAFRMRMAQQRAAEEAGAAKIASAAATAAAREQAAAVATLESRVDALKSSIDPTYAAQKRLNAEMQEATALYKLGAISASDYASAVARLDQRSAAAARGLNDMDAIHTRGAKSAKGYGFAIGNLGSQFADIGVSLASGQALWLVAIQQGSQIAGVFGMMAASAGGLRGALAGMAATLAPAVAAMAPFLIVAGAAAAAMALFHREVSKGIDEKALVAGLKLTEEQLKRVKDQTIGFGDTVKATFQVLGRYIMESPMGDALKALRKDVNAWLDDFASNSIREVAVVVGAFTGAYEGIKTIWKSLPAVMGDIMTSTANAVIIGIEYMVNKTIAAINGLIGAARTAAQIGLLGPAAQQLAGSVKDIKAVTLGRINNPNAGAASNAANNVGGAVERGFLKGRDGTVDALGQFSRDVSKQATKNFLEDVNKQAKDPNKTPKGPKGPGDPRDLSDEQSARLAQEIAQAQRDHLQAILAVTQDIHQRAAIERQILGFETAAKQAQYDGQIATLKDQITRKQIGEIKGKELLADLGQLKAQVGLTAIVQEIAVNNREMHDAAQQELDVRQAQQQSQIDIAKAQDSLLRSDYARAVAGTKTLKAEQDLAEDAIQQQLNKQVQLQLSDEQVQILEAQLAAMKATHAADLEIAKRSASVADAYNDLASAITSMSRAFKADDFAGALSGLSDSFKEISGLLGAGSGLGKFLGSASSSLGEFAGLAALSKSIFGSEFGVLGKLLSGKPSNKGAGYDLVSGQFSGDRRDSETEQAAKTAGDTIKDIEASLKAAGIAAGDTIRGLVIGSRDQSQIYTTGGKTITSAVGDPTAAVNAALGAMLDGATYVSDTQKKLVEDMRAAGKGFDDISAALQGYAQAQTFGQSLQDEILRLSKPQDYDTLQVNRAADAQAKAFQEAADAGYLTSEQLAGLNVDLEKLRGLQLDEVMKRYSDSVEAATRGNELLLQIRQGGVNDALSDLRDAYEAAAAPIRQTISEFESLADNLRQFNDASKLDALSPSGLRKEFDRVGALASQGDKASLQAFTSVASAYRDSIAKTAPDALTAAKENARIRRVTEDALKAAESQIDVAKLQLDALDKSVEQFGILNKTALRIEDAIKALLQAQALQRAAQFPTDANGLLQLGGAPSPTAAADQAWYDSLGDSGLLSLLGRPQGFAGGGMHSGGLRLVGEDGPELEATGPSRIWNAQDTARMIGGGGDNAATERQNALLAEQNALLRTLVANTGQTVKETRDAASVLKAAQSGAVTLKTEAA